jgi:hypothetical protein
MESLERLEREVSSWPDVSAHPDRFGGIEFRFKAAEVGHTHRGGIVDIPFPRSLRDALLAAGLAEEHRWAEFRLDHFSGAQRRRRQPCNLADAPFLLAICGQECDGSSQRAR